jgi:replicative DNA helicase
LEGAPQQALARLSEKSIREKEIRAQADLDAVERENLLPIIANDNLLLAEVMRSDEKRVQELLKFRMEQKSISFEQNLALFKTALENGVLEACQIKRDFPQFFEGLTRAIPGLVVEPKALSSDSNSDSGTPGAQ